MIEKDLARLRFLHTRAMKGEYLSSEDMNFVVTMREQIRGIQDGIEDIIMITEQQEAML